MGTVASSDSDHTTTNGTTQTNMRRPASVVTNDVLIAAAEGTHATGGDIAYALAGGWTLLGQMLDDDTTTVRTKMAIFGKVASSEPSTWQLDAAGINSKLSWSTHRLTGLAPNALSAFKLAMAKKAAPASTAFSTPSLTVTQPSLLMAFFGDAGGSFSVTNGDVELVDEQSANSGLAVYTPGADVGPGTYSKAATSTLSGSAGITALLALPTASTAPTLVASTYEDYTVIDASSSTPGAGGTLSYSISPSAGVIEVAPGVFVAPRSTTADIVYTVTVVETPSGLTDSTPTVTAHQLTATLAQGILWRRWNGTALV